MYAHKHAGVIDEHNEPHVAAVGKLLEVNHHVLVNGPDMWNNTRVVERCFLQTYPGYSAKWTFKTYTLKNETKTDVVLYTRGSSRVFELMLLPQGTIDKHVIQDVVQTKIEMMLIDRETYMLTKHVVVLYNVDKLHRDIQKTVAVLMQRYTHSVTFLVVCTQASNLIHSIVSNAMLYIVPTLDVGAIVTNVSRLERVTDPCGHDEPTVIRALSALQRRKLSVRDTKRDFFDELADKIIRKVKIKDVRADLYVLIVNNIDPVEIVKELTFRLLKFLPHRLVCSHAARVSANIVNSERVIYHLEDFVQNLV